MHLFNRSFVKDQSYYYEQLLSQCTGLFSTEKLHLGLGVRNETGLKQSEVEDYHNFDKL